MLSCRQVTSMASDYRDGALPWPTRVQVWFHLLMCWMCRRYLKQLDLTAKALHKLADRRAPAETPAPLRDTFRAWKAERDRSNTDTK